MVWLLKPRRETLEEIRNTKWRNYHKKHRTTGEAKREHTLETGSVLSGERKAVVPSWFPAA